MSGCALYLHAFGAAGRSWDGVRGRLPQALRGAAPDLPGFGAGGAPACADLDRYLDWALAALDGWSAPGVLVGHSMGGKLALRVAARRPEAVACLVLVAPSPPGAEPMQPGERETHMASFGDAEAAAEAVRASAHHLAPEDTAQLVEDRLAVSRAAWDWWFGQGSLQDIGPELAGVRAPVAVIVGAQDARLGEAAQRRHVLPRLDGRAQVRVVPECGHFVPVEQPAALAAAIAEHAS